MIKRFAIVHGNILHTYTHTVSTKSTTMHGTGCW